jgi:hypothetical protein
MRGKDKNGDLSNRYEILVCTKESIFRGIIECEYGQRLVDALNEGVPTGMSSRGIEFIPLHDVKVGNLSGAEDSYPHLYISKHRILFVAQLALEKEERRLSTYPYRQKAPVKVKIFIPPYTITGDVYRDAWENLLDTLEAQVTFLPITGVEVTPSMLDEYANFEFAAVNKENITCLMEIIV